MIYNVVLIVVSLLMGACVSGANNPILAVGATVCEEPRSQACTRDYRPVCAVLEGGDVKTYSNACTACADIKATAWVEGPCPE